LQLNGSIITGKALVATTVQTLAGYTKLTMVNLKCVAVFLQLEKPGQKKDTLVSRIVAHLTEHALEALVDVPGPIHQNAGVAENNVADDDDKSGTPNQCNLPLGNSDSPLVEDEEFANAADGDFTSSNDDFASEDGEDIRDDAGD